MANLEPRLKLMETKIGVNKSNIEFARNESATAHNGKHKWIERLEAQIKKLEGRVKKLETAAKKKK